MTFVICHFAKQKRLSFPSSTHVSHCLFDLVHCDLRDLFQFQLVKVTNTFLPLWMITLDVLGFTCLNLSQKHKLLLNSFLTWLKLNLVQKSSVLEVIMA